MATRFVAAPAPQLEELGIQEHPFVRAWDGRLLHCAKCPLPKRNRVHVEPGQEQREEWRRADAARLGERDN
jgi:hypothetical protein